LLKAIVFDFDGVIANSEPLHCRAFQDVLAPLGITMTDAEYQSRYLGFDDAGVFKAIGADANVTWSAERIADLVAEKARRMEALDSGVSVLFPGAAAVIAQAAAAVPIAIASGAARADIERILRRADLIHFFRVIVAAEDTRRSKPAPDPYLRAVELLSASVGAPIDPRECVAIEDSVWGIESARAAGLKTIGVAHTYPESGLTGADSTVCAIADLDVRALLD